MTVSGGAGIAKNLYVGDSLNVLNSITSSTNNVISTINSTRIRDKWVKIKIKYTGDKLVVINAIQTLMTISYA